MLLTPTDLSKILNVTSSHVSVLAKNLTDNDQDFYRLGKRVYYSPTITRKIFESRGVDYTKTEIIAFANNKGGVGKTSMAVNTALRLSSMGYKTLLIDADSQASATSYLLGEHHQQGFNLIDVVQDKVSMEEAIHQISPTLSIIKSSLKNSMIDHELQSRLGILNAQAYFSDLLNPLEYNYIIWDLSPTITTTLYTILYSCTKVITVANLDEFAVQGVEMTINLVNKLKKSATNFNPDVGILINRYDERNKSLLNYLPIIKSFEEMDAKLYGSMIKIDTNIQKSQQSRTTLPSNSKAFEGVSGFIIELCEIDNQLGTVRN